MTEAVHIVDDDRSLRKALARLLGAHGLEVHAYETADEFLDAAVSFAGGCVIVDYQMPGLTGLQLQQALAARGGDWQLVFLSGVVDVPKSVTAMKGGAMDVLLKPATDAQIMSAVQRALERGRAARSVRGERDDILARIATLTPREREVMELVIQGLLNKQIADRLGAAERTIKTHRGRVMEKMGVRSVAQLVHLTEKAGIKPE